MITLNSAFEEELYFDFLRDPDSVSSEWRQYFEKIHGKSVYPINKERDDSFQKATPNGSKTSKDPGNYLETETDYTYNLQDNESFEEFSSISAIIAENMQESLTVPTATSVRTIPVKALDENRKIMNRYLERHKRTRVSFTHLILWALVRALRKHPRMNDAYAIKDGKPYRVRKQAVNVGLAVDLERKDGSRLLLVPNVKDAQNLHFSEFVEKFNDIIARARNSKLQLEDLEGTTVTLTNPGMIGTSHSAPRLMKGQGLIIAVGAIEYPPEFQAVRPEVMTSFAISKVVTITSTYDHRIIQGAESAEFLAYLNRLLIGGAHFYDQIFVSLKIPFEPVRWSIDNTERASNLSQGEDRIEKGAHAMQMINAYRVRGHLLSSMNPLGQQSYYYPELDPAYYGFTIWDLDRIFHADDSWEKNNLPLRDIIQTLRDTYCGTTGYEFMHIQEPNKKAWIKKKLEITGNKAEIPVEEKIQIFSKLMDAELFEHFLHTKFVGHKRFSLEGSESLIVLLDKIFEQSADNGLYSVVLGMAHRGRLNVLVNNIGKPAGQIFNEFDEQIDTTTYHGSGDVKYHLGDKGYYISRKNNNIPVILAPNPSHLELVNPVIEGMARALDNEIKDTTYSKTLPILVHGDAAFAGQGIVAETLNMYELEGYKTGGTIHIIINNQIGFTTMVESSRSTIYATDIAKMIQVPIIHVNGNDPEAVYDAALFAYEYRNKFQSDVIIDLISYRKYGHNEADEPSYTQPLMYKKIESMVPVRKVFEKILIKEGVLTDEQVKIIKDEARSKLDDIYIQRTESKGPRGRVRHNKTGQSSMDYVTKVPKDVIQKITQALSVIPENFKAHPKVINVLLKRGEMVNGAKSAIDWATAEALAFGSLLLEGKEVRMSGEDSRRGTFSQRHAAIFELKTEDIYVPLNNIENGQAILRIYDSPLSELAVLGFEYGYSIIATNSLTLWEAQFGDFVNMAQPIIDQFIAAAESKWGQTSNLILLLPHSHEGQGPEHSSARLERFLQLAADDNMIIANFTTPAQYFHALRRQTLFPVKMPMILMTPKSLLRHPKAVSTVEELVSGSFQHIIDDSMISDAGKVRKVLFCTGKVYFDLLNHKLKNKVDDIAIVRVEQLYPLHEEKMLQIFDKYKNVEKFAWVQEEPKNQGAWKYFFYRIFELTEDCRKVKYIGRDESASTATGSFKKHTAQQNAIIEEAFS